MEFSFIHSLKHLAFVQVSAAMYNQIDVKRMMSRIKYIPVDPRKESDWKKVLKRLRENVQNLQISKLLKSELLVFVENMGRRIELWFHFHENNWIIIRNLPNKFYWNSRGTLDAKKMAEPFVFDESLCLPERYELACIYCLKDSVLDLCKLMSVSNKWPAYFEELEDNGEDCVEKVWTDIAENEVIIISPRQNDTNFNERGFHLSALRGNEIGTRYFFQKLTPKQKQNLLVTTAIKLVNCDPESDNTNFQVEYYTDVLCFMLSAMTMQQRREFLLSCADAVLARMAVWPWNCFLPEVEAAIKCLPDLNAKAKYAANDEAEKENLK